MIGLTSASRATLDIVMVWFESKLTSISADRESFILRRLGFDPAASSAPFVATLVDVTGLCIYFLVVLLILRGTLL